MQVLNLPRRMPTAGERSTQQRDATVDTNEIDSDHDNDDVLSGQDAEDRYKAVEQHQFVLVNHLRFLNAMGLGSGSKGDSTARGGTSCADTRTPRFLCPKGPPLPHIYGPTSKSAPIAPHGTTVPHDSTSASVSTSATSIATPVVGTNTSTSAQSSFVPDCQSFLGRLHHHNTARSVTYTRPLEAQPISLGALANPVPTPDFGSASADAAGNGGGNNGLAVAAANLAAVQAAMAKMPVPVSVAGQQQQQQQQQLLLQQAQQQFFIEAQLQAQSRVVYSMGGLLALRALNRCWFASHCQVAKLPNVAT
jgi:hypothetical protein